MHSSLPESFSSVSEIVLRLVGDGNLVQISVVLLISTGLAPGAIATLTRHKTE